MDEQAAVNEPVEITTPMESAPVETEMDMNPESESIDTQQSPADASVEPEKRVSKEVPYERFQEVNSRLNDPDYIARKAIELGIIPGAPAPYQQPELADVPSLDPESAAAVDYLVEHKLEQQRAREFARRNAEDLKNPFIRDRVAGIIREANAKGQRADQEEALRVAKSEFETVVKPAQAQAVAEGQDLAKKKLEAAAVGTTATPSVKTDDSQLSAAEFAAKHGIPRDGMTIS